MLRLFYKYWKTHRLLLVAVIIVVVGVAASGILLLFVLPAYEWSRMVQTLSLHAQRLTIHYVIPPQGKNITIDRPHPKFQTILDLISGSSFVHKWDTSPPYAISHMLFFYLDDGQQIYLDYKDDTLWWGVYQASVDPKLGEVLDSILEHG